MLTMRKTAQVENVIVRSFESALYV